MMASARPVRIGLLWHSVNSGNLGVGALTASNIAILRAEAEALGLVPSFTILGFRDPEPAYVSGPDIAMVPLVGRTMIAPSGYWRAVRGLDCVFDIGAGDSWADIYGGKRFAYLWLTKIMAVLAGKPLVLSPQTIGPFTRQPWTAMARIAMRRAHTIVARDPLSRDVAAAMVPGASVVEAIDVAFALPFTPRPRSLDGKIQVGLNVSGLLFNGGYSGANEFGLEVDYATLMRALIKALLARGDVDLHLFTHVVAPGLPADDDARVADALVAECPGAHRVANFPSPSDAKSWISGLDFVVSGRMHACIAAFSSGVPVVPIAYSRKFAGLFEGVLGYRRGVPVKGLSTEAALSHILAALDDRAAIANEIAEGSRVVDAALARYRAVARAVLAQAAA